MLDLRGRQEEERNGLEHLRSGLDTLSHKVVPLEGAVSHLQLGQEHDVSALHFVHTECEALREEVLGLRQEV